MRLRHIEGADIEIAKSDFCVTNPKDQKNNWKALFPNENPIYLEIGMGKGKFLTEMAKVHPENNYLGMEYYASVLLRAVQKLEEEKEEALKNLLVICQDAEYLLDVFQPGEIEGIYLNFSDPWPKARHAKRRLTSERYRNLYRQLLSEGQRIEFKTDNRDLFDFSVEGFQEDPYFDLTTITYDLHGDEKLSLGNIMTEYEEKFSSKGNPIHKLIAVRNGKA